MDEGKGAGYTPARKDESQMEHDELKSKVGKSATKIWDAYQEVLDELKAVEATASIASSAEAMKTEAAIAAAESVNVEATAGILETVARGLREAKAEFDEVNAAIEAKKADLDRVHGVQVEADSLAAMVEAKDRLVKERVERAAEIMAEANERAAEIREAAAKEAAETRDEAAKADASAEQLRQRAQAEWDYDFNRKKQAQIDEVGDIIAKRLKVLKEQEDAVKEREAEANEKDGEIADLKTKVESMENDLPAKLDAAREEGEKKAAKSFGFQKTIIEKDHEGRINVLEGANAALKERLMEMQSRLAAAEAQVNAAGQRVTDIATASLKSQGDAATISKVAEVAAASGGKK